MKDAVDLALEHINQQRMIATLGQAKTMLKQDIRTCKLLHKHIGKFGITDELMEMAPGMVESTDISIAQEGLLDKIKNLGSKLSGAIKAKWKKFMDFISVKHEISQEEIKKILENIKVIENALPKIKSEFYNTKLCKLPSSQELILKFTAIIKTLQTISSEAFIKKSERGIKYWDLEPVKKSFENFGVFFTIANDYSNINEYKFDFKKREVFKKEDGSLIEKTLKDLNWNASSILKLLKLFVEAYSLINDKEIIRKKIIEIYEDNFNTIMKVEEEFGNTDDVFYEVESEQDYAETGFGIVITLSNEVILHIIKITDELTNIFSETSEKE